MEQGEIWINKETGKLIIIKKKYDNKIKVKVFPNDETPVWDIDNDEFKIKYKQSAITIIQG